MPPTPPPPHPALADLDELSAPGSITTHEIFQICRERRIGAGPIVELTMLSSDQDAAGMIELLVSLAEGQKAAAAPGPEPLTLPALTPATRGEYIAAVSIAMANGRLPAPQGRALLYAAQLSVQDEKTGPKGQGAGVKA